MSPAVQIRLCLGLPVHNKQKKIKKEPKDQRDPRDPKQPKKKLSMSSFHVLSSSPLVHHRPAHPPTTQPTARLTSCPHAGKTKRIRSEKTRATAFSWRQVRGSRPVGLEVPATWEHEVPRLSPCVSINFHIIQSIMPYAHDSCRHRPGRQKRQITDTRDSPRSFAKICHEADPWTPSRFYP